MVNNMSFLQIDEACSFYITNAGERTLQKKCHLTMHLVNTVKIQNKALRRVS